MAQPHTGPGVSSRRQRPCSRSETRTNRKGKEHPHYEEIDSGGGGHSAEPALRLILTDCRSRRAASGGSGTSGAASSSGMGMDRRTPSVEWPALCLDARLLDGSAAAARGVDSRALAPRPRRLHVGRRTLAVISAIGGTRSRFRKAGIGCAVLGGWMPRQRAIHGSFALGCRSWPKMP